MRNKKEIEEYYEEVKEQFEKAENDFNIPEGDFNEIKLEYEILAWVLEK